MLIIIGLLIAAASTVTSIIIIEATKQANIKRICETVDKVIDELSDFVHISNSEY